MGPQHCADCDRYAATALAQQLRRTDIVGVTGGDGWNVLEYFYNKSVHENFMVNNAATEHDTTASFFLEGGAFFDRPLGDILDSLGQPATSVTFDTTPLRRWTVARAPLPVVTSLPYRLSVAMTPAEFMARTTRYDHVQFASNFGDGVCPTRVNAPSRIEYVYRNETTTLPHQISFALNYELVGKGNTFRVFARFDDEPETLLYQTVGPDALCTAFIGVHRDKPYTTLTLAVELNVVPITPVYSGLNFRTARLTGFSMGVYDYTGPVVWGTPLGFMEDRIRNPLRSLHAQLSPVRHDTAIEGLKPGEALGHAYLAPDGGGVGSVRMRLGQALNYLVFKPRVTGTDSVARLYLEVPGREDMLLYDLVGLPGEWTPVDGNFLVNLPGPQPEGSVLRVELQGPGSQLYERDGAFLFHYPPD